MMETTPMTMAKMPLLSGIETLGSVTACATAAHADTEGTRKGQVAPSSWSGFQMHG